MVSDKDLRKTVKECVDDPEHGEVFKNLFSEVVKLHDKIKKEDNESLEE